uniref:Uncharacterized protein n=1 Tax=Anopheles atroparvus TaxID=41427 RepID=A0A182JBV2_ANOAO
MRLARGCKEIYNHRRPAVVASGAPEMDSDHRDGALEAADSWHEGASALAHPAPSRVEGTDGRTTTYVGGDSSGLGHPEHDTSTTPWPTRDCEDGNGRGDSAGTSLHRSLPSGRTADEEAKEEEVGCRWKIRGRIYHRSRVHLLLVAVVLLTQMFVNIRIEQKRADELG